MNYSKEKTLTCRLCLKNDLNGVGIFDEIGLRDGLVVKIWRLFGFVVTIDDETPKIICGNCLPQLEACMSFKSKVEDAQHKLQLSKLAGTLDNRSTVGSNNSGLATHSSPLQQPSTYGWDTIQVANNCSPRTYANNSDMTSISNHTPNKNTVAHTSTDIPLDDANKTLPFSYGGETIKEVTQLWDRLDASQDYLMNVDEHMSTAILDNKYDDILSLYNMQDANSLIKQFPTEDMQNCTWSNDVVDEKKCENKLIGDYAAFVPSVLLQTNMPNTRSMSTQTSITSVHYCSSLTCSKQSSPLQTNNMSSNSSTETAVVNTGNVMPDDHDQNTDSKNSALDDAGSIPSNLWETKVDTVYRSSSSNKHRTSVNQQLVDFYKMSCQDCQMVCTNFSMLQRHSKSVHGTKAVIHCCGIGMTTRQSLINHLKTHFPTQDARSDQLELPSTTTPNLQTSVSSAICEKSPISADLNTSLESPPISLIRGQEVTSSVLLGGQQENSSSPAGKIKTKNRQKPDNSEVTCHVCSKRLKWKTSLPKHLVAHGITPPMATGSASELDPKQCQFCLKIFCNELTKDYHIKLNHPDKFKPVPKYVCITCNEICASKGKLQHHEASAHSSVTPVQIHSCPLCKVTLHTKKGLQAHMHSHRPKLTLKCPFCIRVYDSKLSVSRHVQRTHGKRYVGEGQETRVDIKGK